MAQIHNIERRRIQIGVSRSQSQRARRYGLAFSFAIIGALSFWSPDIAIHVHAGPNLSSSHAWAITLAAPATFLLAYLVCRRFALRRNFKWLGPTMLLGIWLSGGAFMTVAAMASGSEFIGGNGIWRLVMVFMSIIPIVTYVLSAYDGSLFALLAVTIGGMLIWGVRNSWILWTRTVASNGLASQKPYDQRKAA